jgi:phage/conjugal plasmid C-4 type zinc finger TraR family protein
MADDADRATEEEIAFRESNLRRVTKPAAPTIPAAKWCECCGDRIPEARRKAVPSTKRCTECQSQLERRVA